MDTLHNDTGHTVAELLEGIFVILHTAVAKRLPSMGADIGDIPIDYTIVYMIVSSQFPLVSAENKAYLAESMAP